MDNWKYAVGAVGGDATEQDVYTPQTEPTCYEDARTALERLLRERGQEAWVVSPCIVRRSDRHPLWVKVNDHTAELLAEVLAAVAYEFRSIGSGIVQGDDVFRVLIKQSRRVVGEPAEPKEFD